MAPRPLNSPLPIWIGAGGTPQSAVRAGQLGLPLNLANIGGEPARFKPFIDLYRATGLAAGHPALAECAAFGLPDAQWGEVVAVALVLRPGAQADDALAVRLGGGAAQAA